MKSTFLLFVLLVINFYSVSLFSQYTYESKIGDPYTNPKWEYYSENMLSAVSAGKGFSGVASSGDITSICLNPASPVIRNKVQFYFGSTAKSNIYLIPNDNSYYIENGFPSIFAGGIFRFSKYFNLGLIYRNDLSYKEVVNKVSDSVNNLYYADGEISDQMITHNITIPVFYRRERFSVGANVNIINYRTDEKVKFHSPGLPDYNENSYSTLWKLSFQFGVLFQLKDYLSFGATYAPGMTQETEWYFNGEDDKPYSSMVKFPDKFSIGSEVSLMKKRLNLTLDYQFVNNSVYYDYLKNRSNIHFGIEYAVDSNLTLRTGYFTLYDFRNVPNNSVKWPGGVYSYEQFFVTVGGSYKYTFLSFNLAVMDSHLILNSNVSHTKINGGISLDF
jgi:long-subunit fatty acid transport protein